MTKRNKIIYWIATVWLALGMFSTGLVQVLQTKDEIDLIVKGLGFPAWFLPLLGTWKILGVIAVLVPRFPLIKEWAYAGFFFSMTGAVYSHIVVGNPMLNLFGPMLLLVLTVASWYFRPADRRLVPVN